MEIKITAILFGITAILKTISFIFNIIIFSDATNPVAPYESPLYLIYVNTLSLGSITLFLASVMLLYVMFRLPSDLEVTNKLKLYTGILLARFIGSRLIISPAQEFASDAISYFLIFSAFDLLMSGILLVVSIQLNINNDATKLLRNSLIYLPVAQIFNEIVLIIFAFIGLGLDENIGIIAYRVGMELLFNILPILILYRLQQWKEDPEMIHTEDHDLLYRQANQKMLNQPDKGIENENNA